MIRSLIPGLRKPEPATGCSECGSKIGRGEFRFTRTYGNPSMGRQYEYCKPCSESLGYWPVDD